MEMNRANLVLTALGLIASLFLADIASAENKTFIKEYTYMASDIDSKVSSRAIALEQVKRALLEQLGTYLISETEVKNYQLTKDQITTLTAGIVSAEVVEEKWDGRSYYLKAKIAADPKEVIRSVETLRKDVKKSKELEESRKEAKAAMMEVTKLREELESSKTDTSKQGAYVNAANKLTATDWYDKGKQAFWKMKLDESIDAFNNAIVLNSEYAEAYLQRGLSYNVAGNTQKALKDLDKYIELKPQHARSYLARGLIYYQTSKNYQLAIEDFSKAIKLNSKDSLLYYLRGKSYRSLEKYPQSIEDFSSSIRLEPAAAVYNDRALSYAALNEYQKAIKDLDKSIELNPKDASVYYYRAITYDLIGNDNMAVKNFKMAAQLGLEVAQKELDSKGIKWQ